MASEASKRRKHRETNETRRYRERKRCRTDKRACSTRALNEFTAVVIFGGSRRAILLPGVVNVSVN